MNYWNRTCECMDREEMNRPKFYFILDTRHDAESAFDTGVKRLYINLQQLLRNDFLH
jgi:hypothetical protein